MTLLPPPEEVKTLDGTDKKGEKITFDRRPEAFPSALVFKTFSDPFSGRVSLFRVYSGTFKSDTAYWNTTKDHEERIGKLQVLQGKQQIPVTELKAGDIGAVAKLKDTHTGDTLSAKDHQIVIDHIAFPEAAIAFAVEPKARGDEDKLGVAVARIIEEDPPIRFGRDAQTKEFLLSGQGQLHVEIVVSKLNKKYGVDVILHPPKVPYRETITKPADAHGRHKKQSGGHGQFADCKITVEPLPRGADFEFVDEIFGGSIPRQYIPAVEKGIQDARQKGFLAGYPMVDFRVRLKDGQYHDVDSSEMAFKIAGSLAYQEAMKKARADAARADHARRHQRAVGVRRRHHGRPQLAARPRGRRRRRRGHADDPRARPDVGDADVRLDAPLDHAGPRQLPHGDVALRGSAAQPAGEDHHGVEEGEGAAGRGALRRGNDRSASGRAGAARSVCWPSLNSRLFALIAIYAKTSAAGRARPPEALSPSPTCSRRSSRPLLRVVRGSR